MVRQGTMHEGIVMELGLQKQNPKRAGFLRSKQPSKFLIKTPPSHIATNIHVHGDMYSI